MIEGNISKILSGVNAVQTLSRLNRMYKGKNDVFVLDFSNITEEIKDAFDEYYTTTILSEGLDINVINDTVTEIDNIYKIGDETLDEFIDNIQVKDEKEMEKALQELADDNPDKAIDHLKKSWKSAQLAIDFLLDKTNRWRNSFKNGT